MTNASPQRWRHSSGGPWEDAFGYSRAIRTGDHIVVSGCTAVVAGTVRHPGDAAAQMGVALDNVLDAITALGGALGDVIRTRVYVVNRADCAGVGRVHGERGSPTCAQRRPWSWWPACSIRRCSSRWSAKHGSAQPSPWATAAEPRE